MSCIAFALRTNQGVDRKLISEETAAPFVSNGLLTDSVVGTSPELAAARVALRSAVTELQFHDMASQLIWHTTKVLQGCAFRLASEAMGQEEGEEAVSFAEIMPERPNPVTQSEMDAGSIDLF